MKHIFLLIAITFAFESKSQFYFEPDTLHVWTVDTVFNSNQEPIEFYYNGKGSALNNDSIQDLVQAHTDTTGMLFDLGYSFREVAAATYFMPGSNSVASASVINWLDSFRSITIMTDFISDSKRTKTLMAGRLYTKVYHEGKLEVEYEEIQIDGEWKIVYYCNYFAPDKISMITKLDDQGNGYHIEYDGQGKISRSCVYINFEGLDCHY